MEQAVVLLLYQSALKAAAEQDDELSDESLPDDVVYTLTLRTSLLVLFVEPFTRFVPR